MNDKAISLKEIKHEAENTREIIKKEVEIFLEELSKISLSGFLSFTGNIPIGECVQELARRVEAAEEKLMKKMEELVYQNFMQYDIKNNRTIHDIIYGGNLWVIINMHYIREKVESKIPPFACYIVPNGRILHIKKTCEDVFRKELELKRDEIVNYYTKKIDELIDAILYYAEKEVYSKIFVDNEGNAHFPKGITEIPDKAFDGNEELKYAVLPDSVESIGKRAFAGCLNLEKLILNDTLKNIDQNAFSGCKSLKKIDLPDSIQDIGSTAFYDTYFTESVISNSGKIFYYCPIVKGRKTYTVPDTIKVIKGMAFRDDRELEEIILPEGLEKIEKRAFYGLNIKSIIIPASVKELSEDSFLFCKNIENATILCDVGDLPSKIFSDLGLGRNKYIKINAPGQDIKLDKMVALQGKSIADVQKEVALQNIDFWADEKFVLLTKRCADCDTSAMMELGNYYKKYEDDEFCKLASNYWYYNAFLYGNEGAKLWVDRWFSENPCERIPMPILPNKIYKTFEIQCHGTKHYYRGAMLNALGFGFFSPKRDYEIFRFFEPSLVQVNSWCGTEDPDEDGFGAENLDDWWMLDEFFCELPGVKMIHAHSYNDRWVFSKTFDKQYEEAKKALENKSLLS